MSGYIASNQAERAVALFKQIESPDDIIINLLFNACAHLRTKEALDLTRNIYKNLPTSLFSNEFVTTSLLDALVKCGDLSTAEIVFSKMRRSVITYGNLMDGFNNEKQGRKTMKLFHQMKSEGFQTNLIIYLCVIKALTIIGDYSLAESIIEQVPDLLFRDSQLQNALIDMWVRCGTSFLYFNLNIFVYRAKLDA